MKKSKLTLFVLGMALLLLFSGIAYATHHEKIMIHIDGRHIETDVAPQIVDGRTLVPIRFIAENFGAIINWKGETRTVEIISPAKKFAGSFMDRSMYQSAAPNALQQVNAGKGVILDVRPPGHRADGYVGGSIHVPLPTIPDRISEFDSSKTYMVYCVMDINSAYAVAMLNMAGIDAYVVVGGMDALLQAGAEKAIGEPATEEKTPDAESEAKNEDKGDTVNVFTMAEIAQFDGKEGRPAYVVVDGIVYDVTNVPQWSSGAHYGFKAGTDVSEALAKSAPHGANLLSAATIVGKV